MFRSCLGDDGAFEGESGSLVVQIENDSFDDSFGGASSEPGDGAPSWAEWTASESCQIYQHLEQLKSRPEACPHLLEHGLSRTTQTQGH